MLRFGNKEFRNLQEQVFKNMKDIATFKETGLVLDEFGIKMVGQADTSSDLPTVDYYKSTNPDWSYGDAYAVGTETPYELYILTRANDDNPDDFWLNIGYFPAQGPQGEQGPAGETGPQGPTGNTGANGLNAGFGSITASAITLSVGEPATASVVVSGLDTAKDMAFTFGIPTLSGGGIASAVWGSITGSISNQTDLVSALQAKANASALLSYATKVYADNVANNAEYQAVTTIRTSDNEFSGSMIFNNDVLFNSYIYKGQSNYIDYPIELPSGSGTLALTTDIPQISGSYSGAYWTNLTIDGVTKSFAASGGGGGGNAEWGSISGTLSNQTDLMNKFSEYALLSDIPSLSGYATETYVNNALSIYATESWVGSQGYITSAALSEYATISAVSSALSSYALSSSLSLYALSSVVDNLDYLSVGALSSETVIPDITGLASEGYVNTQINNLSSVYAPIGSYATVSELSSAIADLSSVYASISALSEYATESYVTSAIGELNYASVGALSSDTFIPEISGTNDGSYWTSITINEDTYDIPSGIQEDYVPVMVESIDEDGRYAGEIQNSDSAINIQVSKELSENNTYTSLDLYQDDAYLSHSWQETVTKSNPDYDPEDPDSSETIEETVDLSTNIYVGEGTVTVNRSSYDAETEEVINEEVDLFDLATTSALSSAIDSLSSVYQPIGSYALQSELSLYATVSTFNSTVSGIYSTIGSLDYASVGALSSGTSIPVIPASLPANGGIASSISGYASEVFTFTLSNGSSLSKTFLVG